MTAREQLIAYLATLATLAFVFGSALFAAGHDVTVNEAFGLGTITGGLIGVLRIPAARASPEGPAGTTRDPIAVQGADDGKKPVATETTDTA